jgi:hypothetical protein
MEQNGSTTTDKPQEQQVNGVQTEQKEQIVKEEYKDLGEYEYKYEEVPVEKKQTPIFSYGHRIRISKLYENPEEFLYKIIKVSGWARTTRAGGKDFVFIELNDGSSLKGLQVSTPLWFYSNLINR